jgi:hypothetical protein
MFLTEKQTNATLVAEVNDELNLGSARYSG